MSYPVDVEQKSLAGSRLVLNVVRAIQRAYVEEKQEKGITQQSIADHLGLKHRSIVNRWLLGKENLTLRSVGELAWALGRDAEFKLVKADLPGNEDENVATGVAEVSTPATVVAKSSVLLRLSAADVSIAFSQEVPAGSATTLQDEVVVNLSLPGAKLLAEHISRAIRELEAVIGPIKVAETARPTDEQMQILLTAVKSSKLGD